MFNKMSIKNKMYYLIAMATVSIFSATIFVFVSMTKIENDYDRLHQKSMSAGFMIFDIEKIRFYYQNSNKVLSYLHPERYIDIMIGQEKQGFLSEIHPKILSKLKIKDRIGIFEIDFELFSEFSKRKNIEYKEFSKIQESNMDISIVIKDNINWQEIKGCIEKSSKNITKIKVFDVFKNEKIGEDKKSISFNISFGNFSKTPKSEDIEKIWKDVLENLKREFDAKLR